MNEKTENLFKLFGWKLNQDPDAALQRAIERVDAGRFNFARKLNEGRVGPAEERQRAV